MLENNETLIYYSLKGHSPNDNISHRGQNIKRGGARNERDLRPWLYLRNYRSTACLIKAAATVARTPERKPTTKLAR